MASNINRVLITGNLTKDPELHDFDGTKVCRMRIAVNSRSKKSGEWVDKANYFDVVAFGSQGENCNKYLSKGRPLAVDGRLDWNEWEKDGERRQGVQVIADSVQFLDDGKRDEGTAGASEPTTAVSSAAEDDIPF
jgi:single-strand DNA-binding protein